MPDNVFLFYFILLLKCPCVKTQCFWIHTTFFAVILPSFSLHTHRHTHTDTLRHKTLSVVANVGAPEEEITRTQHTTCGSLHILDTPVLFFYFFLTVLLSDFQRHVSVVHDAQHIKTTKPTTIVLVYKYIPFFQHKVYTFFIRVVFCPVVRHFCWDNPGKITTTSPPKKGSLKLRTWWRERVVNSGVFLCVKLDTHTGFMTQNAQLSPFDLFQFGFFFPFVKTHKYSKKIKNK